MDIIKGNEILLQFVSDNWMILLLFYTVVRAMFPNSKLILNIGASFSSMFPIFRKTP